MDAESRGVKQHPEPDEIVGSPSTDTRLAVYGSLAPGKSNHHLLAKYAGTWTRGRVRGDLVNAGWGAAGGFPGLVPRDDGPWVPVQVLESTALSSVWPALDAFEGDEYRRVLIPVHSDEPEAPVLFVANVYALATE
jgi:gamma-glutamylcyclotransferase (GGCT)/AIG2-like uncharacterized protein YtfP